MQSGKTLWRINSVRKKAYLLFPQLYRNNDIFEITLSKIECLIGSKVNVSRFSECDFSFSESFGSHCVYVTENFCRKSKVYNWFESQRITFLGMLFFRFSENFGLF